MLSTYGGARGARIYARACAHIRFLSVERGTKFTARLSSLEYLVKYFTHREIFTHYIHISLNEGVYSFNLIIIKEARYVAMIEYRCVKCCIEFGKFANQN